MFSQCQAIHARSVFPCQDTPDVKATVSFNIRSPYAVIASGVQVGDVVQAEGGEKVYRFEQKVPIPSYLFALASGDIATAPIGKRSVVASGPNELEACKWEFEEDMDRFMEAAESITGVPYQWGEYNVLVVSTGLALVKGVMRVKIRADDCDSCRRASRTEVSTIDMAPATRV